MSSCRQVLASRLHLRAVQHCAHIHIHTHIHNHTRTHTHAHTHTYTHTRTHKHTHTNTHTHAHAHTHTQCARKYPPNATRRPSVLMMVCAVRLGTCNRRSRKERPSPHFLVSGIFAHDHTPQAYTHTSIHTYNRNTHTHIHNHTHTHANYTHEHISLRHNSHHTYVHDHTHIIHTYTNTFMHPHTHTRIPPPNSISSSLLALCSLLHFDFSFFVLWEKLTCGVIRSFNFMVTHYIF